VPASAEIREFVQRLFYHYEGLDCTLWLQLANYGTSEFGLPDAQEVVAKMLKDIAQRIQDAHGVKNQLQRIVTQHAEGRAGG